MKRFLNRQLTNIIFLVLIVGAALTIYLLSRGEIVSSSTPPSATEVAALASSIETPVPDADDSSQSSPRGVPASVFRTHLETTELFSAEESKNDDKVWTLAYRSITAQLRFTVNDGSVSSLEITFDIPQVYDGKATTEIEKYLKEHTAEQTGDMPDALRVLLSDLLPVCDMKNRLSATTARYWAEQALLLKKDGTDYEDIQSGCRFIAYRTARDGGDLLVCTMTFSQ